jgi:segregation and condensation protein B
MTDDRIDDQPPSSMEEETALPMPVTTEEVSDPKIDPQPVAVEAGESPESDREPATEVETAAEDLLFPDPFLAGDEGASEEDEAEPEPPSESLVIAAEELLPVIECLIFVADEPITTRQIAKVLETIPEEQIESILAQLREQYEARGSGLELRLVAGGWRFSTRPQFNDFIRAYHRSRPSARLSLPALETLAVIAYKQPITVPEVLEIRGVSSSSAIKTLLDKGLIETKGRKETVGRPMMYGTAKKFLLQFGLPDLSELPSMEDFEDLVQ